MKNAISIVLVSSLLLAVGCGSGGSSNGNGATAARDRRKGFQAPMSSSQRQAQQADRQLS
jgi:hypothetical protein